MVREVGTTRLVLAGFLGLLVAQGIGRFAFTPLLPMMTSESLVSVTQGGQLASVNFFGYLLGSYLATKLTSKKNMLFESLLLVAVATIAMGLTNNFGLWLFSRLLAGIASAFTMIVVSGAILSLLDSHKNHAWVFGGVGVSIALSGIVTIVLMLTNLRSATGWLFFGCVAVLGAFITKKLAGPIEPKQPKTSEGTSQKNRRPFWSLVIPYGLVGAAYIIPATYLPIMARQTIESNILFGLSWPVFGAAAFLSVLIVARLPDYMSDRRIWILGQIIMCVGLLFPVVHSSLLFVTLAGLCVGATFVVITMVGIREAHRVAGGVNITYHVAIMTTAFALGQMVSPFLAGWIFDQTGTFSAPLLLASVLLAMSLPLLWRDN